MRRILFVVVLAGLFVALPSFGEETENPPTPDEDSTTLNIPSLEGGSCMQMCLAEGELEEDCESDCIQIASRGGRLKIACK